MTPSIAGKNFVHTRAAKLTPTKKYCFLLLHQKVQNKKKTNSISECAAATPSHTKRGERKSTGIHLERVVSFL